MSAASSAAPESNSQPVAILVPMATPALVTAMVNTCHGLSDLIFSPGPCRRQK